MKKTSEDWCDFVAANVGSGRSDHRIYAVFGDAHPHCLGTRSFFEPARHVRRTIDGIIRQAKNDGCMNNRKIRIYMFDLKTLKIELIFNGNVHKDGCRATRRKKHV